MRKYLLAFLFLFPLTGCVSVPDEAEPSETVTSTPSPQAPQKAEYDLAMKAPVQAEASPKTAPSLHTKPATGVDPRKALGWLKNGNTRFQKSNFRKDGQSLSDIKKLSLGQKPHAIVLSCSDSRVPPEIVFDQKLGEIFVVRTAGESLDSSALGSIEYAIENLGTRLILVMGHTSCGAVDATLQAFKGSGPASPHLQKLIGDISPRLHPFSNLPPSKNLKNESWANAKGVAKDLLSRSEIIQAKVSSGEVLIQSALYDLQSGKVDFE